ncbi:MAG: hypothetical protein ACYDHY_09740 [Acidiferrobacterales bacterium]
MVVDLQSGFDPPAALVAAIAAEATQYAAVAMTRFHNLPDSLYRSVLGYDRDGGDLALSVPGSIILDKTGYGLNARHIELLRMFDCDEWHLCGVETDACVLACAFSLWDAKLSPRIRGDLCSSPGFHAEAIRIAERQFGSGNLSSRDGDA